MRCSDPFQDDFVMVTSWGYPTRSEYRCLSGVFSLSSRGRKPGPEFVVSMWSGTDGGLTLEYAINPAYADAGLVLPTCLP
ncbi:MAG: hypothetical protein JNM17_17730 [Archangium sp.]|nr:hypothetical protein [Archangium sp.]